MVVGTEGHMVLPTVKSVNEPQGGGAKEAKTEPTAKKGVNQQTAAPYTKVARREVSSSTAYTQPTAGGRCDNNMRKKGEPK
jgi:hypothetical protein